MKKFLIVLLLFILIFVMSACAKYNYGYLKDAEESPIAGAEIIIGEEETTTNSEGYFSIKNIEEGEYSLIARKEGYKDLKIDNLNFDNKSREIGEIIMEKERD